MCIRDRPYTFFPDIAVNKARHIVVKRRHDLGTALEEGGIHSGMREIFRHLQANKPAADYNDALRFFLLDVRPDAEGILYGCLLYTSCWTYSVNPQG